VDCLADANINVASLRVRGGYNKTITQLLNTITVSQDAVFTGGIFIGALANMTVRNLTIDGTVFSTTAGFLNVSGNLRIDGVAFAQTLGTVNFNGSSLQTITINNPIGVVGFFNMIVNNSGSGLALGGNLKVTNELNMTQGNVALNGYDFMLGILTATGTLTYNSGYMTGLGTFSRWFPITTVLLNISIGDSRGHFPMGEGNKNRSVWIGARNGVITTGGLISVSHTDVDAITNLTAFTDGGESINRRNNTAWNISHTGIALSLGLWGNGMEVRIEGEGLKGVNDYSKLRMVRATDAIGTFMSSTGSNAIPQVNRAGLSLLNNTFYFGGNSGFSPLPVKLIRFTAEESGVQTVINWVTSSERNNSHFVIEKSTDGKSFHAIGSVPASGNENKVSAYAFTDMNSPEDVSYYRLKQVNVDGTYEYSSVIVTANDHDALAALTVYPNPVTGDELNISLGVAGTYHLTVSDLSGRTILNRDIQAGGGEPASISMDRAQIPAGVYMLKISNGSDALFSKIIVR
jgi:hypothetical protein